MSPRRSLVLVALLTLACKRGADVEGPLAASDRETEPSSVQPPQYVRLLDGTALHSAPDLQARVTILHDEWGTGYAVELVGSEGDWVIVETIDSSALADYPGERPIPGFDSYRLRLFVESNRFMPRLSPEPDASREQLAADEPAPRDPPLQAGFRAGKTIDWRVSAGSQVFWPDGRLAGDVRREHAFVYPGHADASGKRICFDARAGADHAVAGLLCFARSDVREADVVDPGVDPNIDIPEGFGGTYVYDPYPSTSMRFGEATNEDAEFVRDALSFRQYQLVACWDHGRPAWVSRGTLTITIESASEGPGKLTITPESGDLVDVVRCIERELASWSWQEGSFSLEIRFGE